MNSKWQDVGNGQVTVDTVRLYIPGTQYTISDKPSLKVISSSKEGHPRHLWPDANGESIQGHGAYWKGEGVHVQLTPGRGLHRFEAPRCFVTVSIPKLCHRYNIFPVNSQQLKGALVEVEDALRSIGIETDVMAALLSRLDVCRDILLEWVVLYYMSILRLLHFPYQTPGTDFDTTASKGNKQRGGVFYDKFAQMLKNHPELRRELADMNLLRTEFRLKNTKAITREFARHCGLPKNGPITAAQLVEHYDVLGSFFISEAKKCFGGAGQRRFEEDGPFPRRLSEYAPTAKVDLKSLHEQQVADLADNFKAGARNQLIKVQDFERQMRAIEERAGQHPADRDNRTDNREARLDEVLRQNGYNRQARSKYLKERAKLLQFTILPCGIPYITLYKELAKKLCAPELTLTQSQQVRQPIPLPDEVDVQVHSEPVRKRA